MVFIISSAMTGFPKGFLHPAIKTPSSSLAIVPEINHPPM
jgi:hypothetical protein